MSISEIAEKLIFSKNEVKLGESAGLSFLLPYMLVDLAYTEFNKVLRNYPFKGEIKRLRNKWRDENKKYFSLFFSVIGEEARDDMIALMDDFEEKMSDLCLVMKVQVMNAVQEIPFESQKVIAAAQFCNLMYQEANIFYREKHQSVKTVPLGNLVRFNYSKKDDPYLVRAREYSVKFSSMYYAPFQAAGVSLGEKQGLRDAVGAFENRLLTMVKSNG